MEDDFFWNIYQLIYVLCSGLLIYNIMYISRSSRRIQFHISSNFTFSRLIFCQIHNLINNKNSRPPPQTSDSGCNGRSGDRTDHPYLACYVEEYLLGKIVTNQRAFNCTYLGMAANPSIHLQRRGMLMVVKGWGSPNNLSLSLSLSLIVFSVL